jgi:hypothetical protein
VSAVRSARSNPSESTRAFIVLRQGTFYLSSPIELGTADSYITFQVAFLFPSVVLFFFFFTLCCVLKRLCD